MNVISLILLIGIPMLVMQALYRLYDPQGDKTIALSEKLPVLMGRKFLMQIVTPLLFIVVFGVISVLLHIPIAVFYVVCGVVLGVINGMAVTLMYFGDRTR